MGVELLTFLEDKMSQFSDVMEKVWGEILDFLSDAFNWVKPIFSAALKQLIKGGGATLIAAATNAVAAAQAHGGTGDEKYEIAFKAVKETIKDSGQDVVDSAINLAIEMAVAKLKDEQVD